MTRPALTRGAGEATTTNTSALALVAAPVSTAVHPQEHRGVRIGAQPAMWSASTGSQRSWKTWWIMTDPMTGPRLVDSPCNGATLPNCDCCGRFTSRPTRVDNSWRGGAGMFVCAELLLCPHCTDNCSLIITHKETR